MHSITDAAICWRARTNGVTWTRICSLIPGAGLSIKHFIFIISCRVILSRPHSVSVQHRWVRNVRSYLQGASHWLCVGIVLSVSPVFASIFCGQTQRVSHPATSFIEKEITVTSLLVAFWDAVENSVFGCHHSFLPLLKRSMHKCKTWLI